MNSIGPSQVERLEVVWPDGTRAEAGPFLASSLVTWERGAEPRCEPLPGRRSLDADARRQLILAQPIRDFSQLVAAGKPLSSDSVVTPGTPGFIAAALAPGRRGR